MNSHPPTWNQLQHAYGRASDIPGLLGDLQENPDSGVAWDQLWQAVCHQGTTYPASPHILPALLHFASQWPPHLRLTPLDLAGAIAAAKETDLTGFTDSITELRTIALQTLPSPQLDQRDRMYLIQAILAFEGDRQWGRNFDRLHDAGFTGICPHCGTALDFAIGEDGMFCCADDYVRNPAAPRTPILPASPESLNATGQKLHALCNLSTDPDLPTFICHLFGTTTCPDCNTALEIPPNLNIS
jgi:hypothetical protein